jgi:hypothetical protein
VAVYASQEATYVSQEATYASQEATYASQEADNDGQEAPYYTKKSFCIFFCEILTRLSGTPLQKGFPAGEVSSGYLTYTSFRPHPPPHQTVWRRHLKIILKSEVK